MTAEELHSGTARLPTRMCYQRVPCMTASAQILGVHICMAVDVHEPPTWVWVVVLLLVEGCDITMHELLM